MADVGVMVLVAVDVLVAVAVAVLVTVGELVRIAVVAVLVAVGLLVRVTMAVAVAVSAAVGVRLGVISKFPRPGASELSAGVTFVAVNSRITNKIMIIQRLANLFLRSRVCDFSVVRVTEGTSGLLRNWSTISLSSFLG